MLDSNRTIVISKVLILAIGLTAGDLIAHQRSVEAGPAQKPKGNVAAGRSVFNGKGVCYYCHGIDGNRDKVPQLAGETASLIAQLNPPPADLRSPKSLRLMNDNARAKAIREGHPGTGMFPDTTLKDFEIRDVLAYLAMLRDEGAGAKPRRPR